MTSSPIKLSSVSAVGEEVNVNPTQNGHPTVPSSPMNIYSFNTTPSMAQLDEESLRFLKRTVGLTTIEQTELSTLVSGTPIRETYIWGTRVNASETFLTFRRFLLEFKRPQINDEEPYYLALLKQVFLSVKTFTWTFHFLFVRTQLAMTLLPFLTTDVTL
jgi:hypothetical protein